MITSFNFRHGVNTHNQTYAKRAQNAASTFNNTLSEKATEQVADTRSVQESRQPKSLFAAGCFVTDSAISVFKADCWSVENPIYRVVGHDRGQKFDLVINANEVNPSSASFAEMSALQSHLLQQGKISSVVPFFVRSRADDGSLIPGAENFSFLHSRLNFVEHFKEMYLRNTSNPWREHANNIGRLLQALDSILDARRS